MCGGTMNICHVIGLGLSCTFMWLFFRLVKVPDLIVFDKKGRSKEVNTEKYY
jgi:hypothetical protein